MATEPLPPSTSPSPAFGFAQLAEVPGSAAVIADGASMLT
jgi:hypothetical protein